MDQIPGLVSVTIPFRNSAPFLVEAIESVLAQSYADWELILIDDGSSDGSQQIAQRFSAHAPRQIHYHEHDDHQNLGVTRSRNLGASLSRGEYLAFLDSDDVWLPGKLTYQVGVLQETQDAGAVVGPSEYWYDWDAGANETQQNYTPPLAPGDRVYSPPDLFLMTHPIGPLGAPCPSSLLLRRTVFDSVSGFVEEFHPASQQLFEDAAFLTKIYFTQPVFVSERSTDRYRCHPKSIWHRTMGTVLEEAERRFYFSWLHGYLKKSGISDPAIWRDVRKHSWMYSLGLPDGITLRLRRRTEQLRRRLARTPVSR